MIKSQTVSCYKCKYLTITYNKNFPFACKALNFKSKVLPSVAVRQSSGKECLYFAAKERLSK